MQALVTTFHFIFFSLFWEIPIDRHMNLGINISAVAPNALFAVPRTGLCGYIQAVQYSKWLPKRARYLRTEGCICSFTPRLCILNTLFCVTPIVCLVPFLFPQHLFLVRPPQRPPCTLNTYCDSIHISSTSVPSPLHRLFLLSSRPMLLATNDLEFYVG